MENDSAFHTFKQFYTCTTARFRCVIHKWLNLHMAKLANFHSFCILKQLQLHNTCLSDHRTPCGNINFHYDFEPAKQLPSNIRAKTSAIPCHMANGRDKIYHRRLRLCSHGTGPKWIRPYPGTDYFCSHSTVPLINVSPHETSLLWFGTESK